MIARFMPTEQEVRKTKEEKKLPFFAGCLTWGLTGLAAFLSLMVFGLKDEQEGTFRFTATFACLIIGPMWSAVVILCGRAAGASKIKTYVYAGIAWAITASFLTLWGWAKSLW